MNRYPSSARQFSLSHEDFERDSVLKRRRQSSPARDDAAESKSSSISVRTRSKSKSRAPESTLRRLPSVQGQEFYVLGRNPKPRSTPSPSPRGSGHTAARSPSTHREDRGRKRERSVHTDRGYDHHSTRSKSKVKALEADVKEKLRSNSKSRKRMSTRSRSRSRSRSPGISSRGCTSSQSKSKRQRSQSVARAESNSSAHPMVTASSSSPSPPPASSSKRTADKALQRDIERNEKKLKQAKSELSSLEDELSTLQKRVDAKKYEVMDQQIVVDGLNKRRKLQEEYFRRESVSTASKSKPSPSRRSPSPERQLSSRGSRRSKRPCILDEDGESSDDDVEILDPPVRVKPEPTRETRKSTTTPSTRPSSSSSSSTRRASSGGTTAMATTTSSTAVVATKAAVVDQMSDHFWGRVDIAKLLVQPRTQLIPDGSSRKGRHLAFNPAQHDYFAVGSDDGGLILWSYARQTQQVAKIVSFDPASFRRENQCAESMAWSPDGERLAISFRDPLESMGEFCVLQLHQVPFTDGQTPQQLPRDRIKSKSTTLHGRGISAIEWVPGGYGDSRGSRGLVTTGPDHAVVLWEEHSGQTDYKWRVLHREHRSDVRSICMHSQGNSVYTGGLDGMVIRYDLHSQRTHTIMERRRPHISKINSVLENPHNPNLLMVSSVEQSEHNLLLHDLRVRYDEKKTMTLSWMRSSDSRSMSQYIVPRWSPGGFHVSCGSTSGQVNIWDVRVRGDRFPLALPQQSISVHQKQVLHATWHPRYDAMFSVSHDRNIGLLTFR